MEVYIAAGIGALVSLIGSSLVFLATVRRIPSQNRKDDADSRSADAETGKTLAETNRIITEQLEAETTKRIRLETQVNEQGSMLANMQIELRNVKGRVTRLEAQVVSLGATPVQ